MKANKALQATVVYVFFLGLSMGALGFCSASYFAGADNGVMTAYNLAVVLVTGALSVACYRDLRSLLKPITAPEPEPVQSQPERANKVA